jgi:hypothetical protein
MLLVPASIRAIFGHLFLFQADSLTSELDEPLQDPSPSHNTSQSPPSDERLIKGVCMSRHKVTRVPVDLTSMVDHMGTNCENGRESVGSGHEEQDGGSVFACGVNLKRRPAREFVYSDQVE